MCNRLSARPFGAQSLVLPEIQSFDCGDDAWALTINNWIKNGDAVNDMRKRGTKIWLYYDSSSLVGYGSLGATRWPSLFPNDPKKSVLILPNLGVQKKDHRKGFGSVICQHLIGEAQNLYRERVEKGKSIAPILSLLVHPNNSGAKTLYKSVGFIECDYSYYDADDGVRYEGMVKLLSPR